VQELIVFLGALAVVAAGAGLIVPFRRRAQRGPLFGVPVTPIAAIADGADVRIQGRAVARAPLRTSPISRRDCIGFRLIIDSDGGGGDAWHRVVEQEEFDSFVVRDETGEAVLHGPFEIKLDPYDSRSENNLPPELPAFLESEGVPVNGSFGIACRFRYVETVLLPGDAVSAFGRATLEIDAAGRSRSPREPPLLCHFKGREDAVVIAGADDGS